MGKLEVLRSLSTGSPAGHLSVERRLNVQLGLHKFVKYPGNLPEDILGKLTSVAPCDQSRTEKVPLGSSGGSSWVWFGNGRWW